MVYINSIGLDWWYSYNCDLRLHFFWCNCDKTIYEYLKYIGINTHNAYQVYIVMNHLLQFVKQIHPVIRNMVHH